MITLIKSNVVVAERNDNGYYNVDDVVNWFLSKDSMSHKKLQKLIYYAYSWTLALLNDSPNNLKNKLYENNIEAWVHGPVVPEVYHAFKSYGYHDINKRDLNIVFDEEINDVLNQVWEVYGGFTGNELESITHQESPWIEARNGIPPLEISNKPLSNRLIFEFYLNEMLQAED